MEQNGREETEEHPGHGPAEEGQRGTDSGSNGADGQRKAQARKNGSNRSWHPHNYAVSAGRR